MYEHYPGDPDPEIRKKKNYWGQCASHMSLYFLNERVSVSGSLSLCSP